MSESCEGRSCMYFVILLLSAALLVLGMDG
jgi:hypothetical protein